jgi:glycine/D-amino acid oxidase-like deaminating enzyme
LIGEDSTVKGFWHSAGHEGAGIGLAPGSAALITDAILGRDSFMDPHAFSPKRFVEVLK